MARTALLNIMVNAAIKAGKTLARDFGEVENLQVSVKGPANFVSAADRKAEQTLIAELSRARPGFGFLTEESDEIIGTDTTHRWIIDPLDGTTNFLHGIPIFAISIALERQGEIVAGVVHNPVMNETFVAERGGGTYFNERRIRVAARSRLAECVIATGIPHLGRGPHGEYLAELREVMGGAAGVRRCGSAALDLAWTASGRFDAFWEHSLYPWDMAAGILLVTEAGGLVTDESGRSNMMASGSIVAGNANVHRLLMNALRQSKVAA